MLLCQSERRELAVLVKLKSGWKQRRNKDQVGMLPQLIIRREVWARKMRSQREREIIENMENSTGWWMGVGVDEDPLAKEVWINFAVGYLVFEVGWRIRNRKRQALDAFARMVRWHNIMISDLTKSMKTVKAKWHETKEKKNMKMREKKQEQCQNQRLQTVEISG